jgi:hypothetical protein
MSKKQKVDQLVDVFKIDLETLLRLSRPCVYALKHRLEKRIQIFGSMNALVHLGRVLEDVKASGEYTKLRDDLKDVQLVILETDLVQEDLRLSTSNWIYKYECMGYVLYKDIAPLKYILETTLEYKAGRLCYFLYAKSNPKSRILLGIFDKKKHLMSFKREHYPGKRISALIVHESASI